MKSKLLLLTLIMMACLFPRVANGEMVANCEVSIKGAIGRTTVSDSKEESEFEKIVFTVSKKEKKIESVRTFPNLGDSKIPISFLLILWIVVLIYWILRRLSMRPLQDSGDNQRSDKHVC